MMYLLDTHVLLWYFMGSDELGDNAKQIIETKPCFYSPATLWEIAIKQSRKKLDLQISIPALEEKFLQAGFSKLQITSHQLEKIKTLDEIHKDPFDRLLIAQAQQDSMTILTGDRFIKMYDVSTTNART